MQTETSFFIVQSGQGYTIKGAAVNLVIFFWAFSTHLLRSLYCPNNVFCLGTNECSDCTAATSWRAAQQAKAYLSWCESHRIVSLVIKLGRKAAPSWLVLWNDILSLCRVLVGWQWPTTTVRPGRLPACATSHWTFRLQILTTRHSPFCKPCTISIQCAALHWSAGVPCYPSSPKFSCLLKPYISRTWTLLLSWCQSGCSRSQTWPR